MSCVTCKAGEDEDDRPIQLCECDFCHERQCLTCSNVSTTEYRCLQLKKRVLMYRCNVCKDKKDEEKYLMETINHLIELFKKETNEIKEQIKKELDENKNEMHNIKTQVTNIAESNKDLIRLLTHEGTARELTAGNRNLNQGKKSYADASKCSEVVVIQPKKTQQFMETKTMVQSEVKPAEISVGISNIHKLKNGGVAISCKNKEEVQKLKNEVENKLGKDYNIKIPKQRNPHIKIVGLSQELSEENVKKSIKNQNVNVGSKMKHFKIHVMKKMKTKYFIIAEVNNEMFQEIMVENEGILNIEWDRCSVYEYFNVVRCFKCGRYNHKVQECKATQTCLKCGESNHKSNECTNVKLTCINCKESNEKLHLKLNTDHSVYDGSCSVFQRIVESIKRKTNYTI